MELWLPPGVGDEQPRFVCRVCKARFLAGQETVYARHVGRCRTRNEAELRERSPREQHSFWLGDSLDPEYERFLRTRARVFPDGSWSEQAHRPRNVSAGRATLPETMEGDGDGG